MRIVTTVVIFFILLNSFAFALQQSGVTEKWETRPDTGDTPALTDAQTEAEDVSASGGGLSTLFGLIVSVGSTLSAIFAGALPAVDMLSDLGVPGWFLGFMTAPLVVISAVELADFFRGIG